MFKKPLSHLKTSSPLRSSDCRKLRQRIVAAFGLTPEQGDVLVPDGTLSVKFSTYTNETGVSSCQSSISWYSVHFQNLGCILGCRGKPSLVHDWKKFGRSHPFDLHVMEEGRPLTLPFYAIVCHTYSSGRCWSDDSGRSVDIPSFFSNKYLIDTHTHPQDSYTLPPVFGWTSTSSNLSSGIEWWKRSGVPSSCCWPYVGVKQSFARFWEEGESSPCDPHLERSSLGNGI